MPTKRRTKKGEKYKGFAVEKGNGERDLSDIKYTSSQPKGRTHCEKMQNGWRRGAVRKSSRLNQDLYAEKVYGLLTGVPEYLLGVATK